MRVFWQVLGLALAGGAVSAGCVEDVRFNPSGCQVQVRGRWLVDGQNPTLETCGNIALVELAIINAPQTEFWIPPEFSLRCDAASDSNAVVIDGGAYIDTRIVTRNRCGGTGRILRVPPIPPDAGAPPNGEWNNRWRATTGKRFVVDCSPIVATPIMPAPTIGTDAGTELLLDVGTVNFVTRDGGAVCPPP